MFQGAMLWNRLLTNMRKEVKIAKFKQAVRKWIAAQVPRFKVQPQTLSIFQAVFYLTSI